MPTALISMRTLPEGTRSGSGKFSNRISLTPCSTAALFAHCMSGTGKLSGTTAGTAANCLAPSRARWPSEHSLRRSMVLDQMDEAAVAMRHEIPTLFLSPEPGASPTLGVTVQLA